VVGGALITGRAQSSHPPAGYQSFQFEPGALDGVGLVKGTAMTKFLQVMGWLLLLTIVVLSLAPPTWRPTTGFPRGLEHLAIFLPTGLAFGLGYPNGYLSRIIPLILFAAVVELSQLLIPGRHARLSDFLIEAGAIIVGVGCGLFVARYRTDTSA